MHLLPSTREVKELTDVGKYYKEHDHSLEGYKAEEKK